ncbi:MAG: hypothetical protein ACP5K8_04555 [Nitrososphaeria archaeon]
MKHIVWLGIYLSTDEIVGQVVDDELKTVSLRRRPIISYTPLTRCASTTPSTFFTSSKTFLFKAQIQSFKFQHSRSVCGFMRSSGNILTTMRRSISL